MIGRRTGVLAATALALASVLGVGIAVREVTRDTPPSIAEVDAEVSRRLTEEGVPRVGLGEASPPLAEELQAGWSTDFDNHSVPFSEITSGGPGKDGIPAIDAPRFVSVPAVGFLRDREPVIELALGGEVRGYPIQILMWHEIVNDEIAGTPVAVTFCPLCNTAIAFDRRVDGRLLDFGTTGNLRHSDLVMYDRQTESWWQQFSGEAIVGDLTGRRLEQLPARIVSWGDFRRRHPDGNVLSRDTGFSRTYGDNPYAGYDDIDSPPYFAAANEDDDRLPPKERVVYLEAGDDAVAVPYSTLRARRELEVKVGDRTLLVRWAPGVASALDDYAIAEGADIGSAEVVEDGRPVVFVEPFWFSVAAFRPDVRIVR